MKQASNEVNIEGILSQVDIRDGVAKKTGKKYLGGNVIVRVITDDGRELEIPVHIFANEKTNDGRDNPAYQGIKDIQNMKSIASVGGDVSQADYILFNKASIRENIFVGRDGQTVSSAQVNASFANPVRRDDLRPRATFDNVIVVGGIREEEDRNGELTGRLVITGIIPQFGDKVDKVDFIVENEAAIKHISNNWKKGDTVRVCGLVNFTYKTVVETIEMGFGEPEIKTHTRSVKEFIITKGSASGFDGDAAYDVDEIAEALQRRQAYISELKANVNNPAQAAREQKTDFGF